MAYHRKSKKATIVISWQIRLAYIISVHFMNNLTDCFFIEHPMLQQRLLQLILGDVPEGEGRV